MARIRLGALAAVVATFVVVSTRSADASIIFTVGPGGGNPEEQILFNAPGLANDALTVEGITSDTDTIFNITGLEPLHGNGGQARVESVDPTGYLRALFEPQAANLAFEEFKANINIFAKTSGLATITACNPSWTGGACSVFGFALSAGQNFFVLTVTSADLLRSVLIETTVPIEDIRQIRVGGIQRHDVPEPGSLALLALGLAGAAARRRMRKT